MFFSLISNTRHLTRSHGGAYANEMEAEWMQQQMLNTSGWGNDWEYAVNMGFPSARTGGEILIVGQSG